MSLLFEVLSWYLGLQFVFWGFNGFFGWLPPPPAGAVISDFVKACEQARFIMPTVKLIEIISGLCLLIPTLQVAGGLLLAPIVFVIAGLQALHHPRPRFVIITLVAPYGLWLGLLSYQWMSASFN